MRRQQSKRVGKLEAGVKVTSSKVGRLEHRWYREYTERVHESDCLELASGDASPDLLTREERRGRGDERLDSHLLQAKAQGNLHVPLSSHMPVSHVLHILFSSRSLFKPSLTLSPASFCRQTCLNHLPSLDANDVQRICGLESSEACEEQVP